MDSTLSASLSTTSNISGSLLNKDTFIAVLSGLSGGLFAGWFGYLFESRRRLFERRLDKYIEHRNTIVQIEHELIPVRVNLSRDIESIKEALDNINADNIRLILRFYKFTFSTGLSLKLVNLDLINMYSEMYTLLHSINSDFDYISGIINTIIDEGKIEKLDLNKVKMYSTFLGHLKNTCDKADKQTLKLLSFCQCVLAMDDTNIKNKYIKKGKEIKYRIPKKSLTAESTKTIEQETAPYKEGEKRPQFVAPYMDIKKDIKKQIRILPGNPFI